MQNLRNLYVNQINVFLDQNTRSSDFYHFFEDPENHLYANKLNLIKIDRIPTYKDWIDYSIKNDTVSIFANADMYFDDSINKVYKYLEKPNSLMCLSRHEDLDESIKPHNKPQWSQDIWAIDFRKVNEIGFIKELDFSTGKYRCDNKIAYIFSVHGWDLYNPFYEIKSYHRHKSKIRTYDKADTSIIGSLAFVSPTTNPENPSIIEYHIMPIKTANIKKEAIVSDWLENQIRVIDDSMFEYTLDQPMDFIIL